MLLVDVQARTVEHFTEPAEGGYRQRVHRVAGHVVQLESVGVEIALKDVFPG